MNFIVILPNYQGPPGVSGVPGLSGIKGDRVSFRKGFFLIYVPEYNAHYCF